MLFELIDLGIQIIVSLIIGVVLVVPFLWLYHWLKNRRIKKNIPLEVQKDVYEEQIIKLKQVKGGSNEIYKKEETGSSRFATEPRTFPAFKPTTGYTSKLTGGPTNEDNQRELANSHVAADGDFKPIKEGRERNIKRNWPNFS